MKKTTGVIVYAVIMLAAVLGCVALNSSDGLTFNNYNLKTDKLKGSVKFVLISDLHNKEFGEDNERLVSAVRRQEPDFIAICGDMVTETEATRKPVVKLLPKLCEIAPVYYALGNHERYYCDLEGLIEDIKSSGAVLLDNEMTSFYIGGESITVGGLTDFPYYEYYAPDYDNEQRRFLDSFIAQEDENYSILLAHQPEFYFWGLEDKDIDLMLCGHTHGGIIRLPFIGAVYAPNQGLFPQYDMGYYSGTANMLITSGLGNSVPLPRFCNPPEICVVSIN